MSEVSFASLSPKLDMPREKELDIPGEAGVGCEVLEELFINTDGKGERCVKLSEFFLTEFLVLPPLTKGWGCLSGGPDSTSSSEDVFTRGIRPESLTWAEGSKVIESENMKMGQFQFKTELNLCL